MYESNRDLNTRLPVPSSTSSQRSRSMQSASTSGSASSQWAKKRSNFNHGQPSSRVANPSSSQQFVPQSSLQPPERSSASSLENSMGHGQPVDTNPLILPWTGNPSYFPYLSGVQTPVVSGHPSQGGGYQRINRTQHTAYYTRESGPGHIPSPFPVQSSIPSTSTQPSNVPQHGSAQRRPRSDYDPSRVDIQQHSAQYFLNPGATSIESRSFPPLQPHPSHRGVGFNDTASVQPKNASIVPSQSAAVTTLSYSSVVTNARQTQRVASPLNTRSSTSNSGAFSKQRTRQSIPVQRPPPQRLNNSAGSDNNASSSSENRLENWVVEECKKLPLNLRAFFIVIIQSGCCVDGELEPIHGSQGAETMRRLVVSQGHQIPVTVEEAGKSICYSFIDGRQCLICGEAKGSHALECVRKHLRHRPFLCTSDDCVGCNGKPRQAFHEYSRLKEHLSRPTKRAICVHCKREFRQDNKKRHQCAGIYQS